MFMSITSTSSRCSSPQRHPVRSVRADGHGAFLPWKGSTRYRAHGDIRLLRRVLRIPPPVGSPAGRCLEGGTSASERRDGRTRDDGSAPGRTAPVADCGACSAGRRGVLFRRDKNAPLIPIAPLTIAHLKILFGETLDYPLMIRRLKRHPQIPTNLYCVFRAKHFRSQSVRIGIHVEIYSSFI